jgi:hypothetical protein
MDVAELHIREIRAEPLQLGSEVVLRLAVKRELMRNLHHPIGTAFDGIATKTSWVVGT